MRTTRYLTAALIAVLASLTLVATAFAAVKRETASAPLSSGGSVSATLSYDQVVAHGVADDSKISLRITRAGQQAFDATIGGNICAEYCSVGQGDGSQAVHVTDVQGNGEPDAFVDLFTGGAHCCTLTDFFTYDPATRAYTEYQQDWGDPGYALKRLDGRYVFYTANDAFAYEFTDYAASGLPLLLDSFNGIRMVNVTRQHPALIRHDAAQWLKAFQSQAPTYGDSTGVIAAWAADEDELGNDAFVARYLDAQAAAGHLNTGLSPEEPSGGRFVTKLDRFLRSQGYLR